MTEAKAFVRGNVVRQARLAAAKVGACRPTIRWAHSVGQSSWATNGDNSYLVTENESTFIPVGQVHALENPGQIPLELVEVQSGSYLGEDDIVRMDDIYGRE